LTKLYTHNVDVDAINNEKLRSISGKTRLYEMRAAGRPIIIETLKHSCLAPEKLFLKTGAMVMFVKNNFEQGYVNGTLGKVVDFDEKGLPIVETIGKRRITATPASWVIQEDEIVKGEIMQIPLRLAWAITIHKSQGMSLDAAEIDLSKSFEAGMGYVALSRVRTLEGIKLIGLNDLALLINQDILRLDEELKILSQAAVAELQQLNEREKADRQKKFLESAAAKSEMPRRPKNIPGATYQETKALTLKKLPIKDMAKTRGLTEGTIVSHLEKLIKRGEKIDLEYLKPSTDRFTQIKDAFAKSGELGLSPVREILGDSFSYDELRLARLFLMNG